MSNKQTKYSICTRCIMRVEDDPHIVFDASGVCSYCHLYDNVLKKRLAEKRVDKNTLSLLIDQIKKDGAGLPYDCILGVSGGIDSTYSAYLAVKLGLRPLLVSFDNGWDTGEAKSNIENLVARLGLTLETVTMDGEEFRDLQLAYLYASVVDIEAPTDHAIAATLFRAAEKYNVKYIISGENYETEGIMPPHWIHNKTDAINIKAIHKRYGKLPLKTFPMLSLKERRNLIKVKHIQIVRLLDYEPYNKQEAIEKMQKELGWIDYKQKHFESIFTRFYQAYILPKKFNADKRRLHLSVLIQSGQLTRGEALDQIAIPPLSEAALLNDKKYVLAKLRLSDREFEKIMQLPVRSHYAFATQQRWRYIAGKIKRLIFK